MDLARIRAAVGDVFDFDDVRIDLQRGRHAVVRQIRFTMRQDDARMVAARAVIDARPWFLTGVGEKPIYVFRMDVDGDGVCFLGDDEPVAAVLEAMAGAADRQELNEAELRRRLAVQDAVLGRRVFDNPRDYRHETRRDIALGFNLLRDDIETNCRETLKRYDAIGRKPDNG